METTKNRLVYLAGHAKDHAYNVVNITAGSTYISHTPVMTWCSCPLYILSIDSACSTLFGFSRIRLLANCIELRKGAIAINYILPHHNSVRSDDKQPLVRYPEL